MNKIYLQLKTKVEKQAVKQLTTDVIELLKDIEKRHGYSTLIEQATILLFERNIYKWPLSDEHQHILNACHGNVKNIPRYLKILILHNYKIHSVVNEYQILWLFLNSPNEIPKCELCGAPTHWSSSQKRYTRHCSNRCRALDPNVDLKRKTTSINRYGYDTLLNDDNHSTRTRETCLENNGVLFPLQNNTILQKTEQSKEDKYGSDYKYIISDRVFKTLQKRYGEGKSIGDILNSEQFISKKKKTRIDNWLPQRIKSFQHSSIPLFDLTEFKDRFQNLSYQCVKCSTIFSDNIRDGTTPRCPSCYPLNHTHFNQQEVVDFIRSVYDGNVQVNVRNIIKPKELDIYLPDVNLAIEYNGLYWHSDIGSNGHITIKSHLDKTNECNEKGIRLLHIFEDEWFNKQNLVKSIISSAMGKNKKIHARKCRIETLSSHKIKQFVDENHIQGHVNSKVNISLIYEGNIVSVITLGKSRYSSTHEWEIYRMCSLQGITVVGGFNKMISHFIKTYAPKSIITYSERRLFNGNIYDKMGFDFLRNTQPGYWYVDLNSGCRERFNRLKYQKYKLPNLFENVDMTLTADEIMKQNNFGKVWDCGQSVWEWKC